MMHQQLAKNDRGHIMAKHQRRDQVGWKPVNPEAYAEQINDKLQLWKEEGKVITSKDMTELITTISRTNRLVKLKPQVKSVFFNQLKAMDMAWTTMWKCEHYDLDMKWQAKSTQTRML